MKHLFKRRRLRHKSDTARLAARLAPLEEQPSRITTAAEERELGVRQETGAIVVDRNSLPVPKEMVESSKKGFLGMEPVVLVIVGLMLGFIAFVAWKISEMPLE